MASFSHVFILLDKDKCNVFVFWLGYTIYMVQYCIVFGVHNHKKIMPQPSCLLHQWQIYSFSIQGSKPPVLSVCLMSLALWTLFFTDLCLIIFLFYSSIKINCFHVSYCIILLQKRKTFIFLSLLNFFFLYCPPLTKNHLNNYICFKIVSENGKVWVNCLLSAR